MEKLGSKSFREVDAGSARSLHPSASAYKHAKTFEADMS